MSDTQREKETTPGAGDYSSQAKSQSPGRAISLDDSPCWLEKPYRRGERSTEMFLRLGWITEDQVVD